MGFTYKSYNFLEKDPIIDEIRTLYEDSGVNYAWIHENSGVSMTTLSSWFSGETRKPQCATVNAVVRALGFKLGFVPHAEPVRIFPRMPQPQPKARAPEASNARPQSARHVVQMAKYKKGGRR